MSKVDVLEKGRVATWDLPVAPEESIAQEQNGVMVLIPVDDHLLQDPSKPQGVAVDKFVPPERMDAGTGAFNRDAAERTEAGLYVLAWEMPEPNKRFPWEKFYENAYGPGPVQRMIRTPLMDYAIGDSYSKYVFGRLDGSVSQDRYMEGLPYLTFAQLRDFSTEMNDIRRQFERDFTLYESGMLRAICTPSRAFIDGYPGDLLGD